MKTNKKIIGSKTKQSKALTKAIVREFNIPKLEQYSREPSHLRFSYGRHSQPKEVAIGNAKRFLTAIFEERSKLNLKDIKELGVEYFSYHRITDKNVGALLHGVPKSAKKMYESLNEFKVEAKFGINVENRIKANELYQYLRRSPLVGGTYLKPADLSKFENLVSLMLK